MTKPFHGTLESMADFLARIEDERLKLVTAAQESFDKLAEAVGVHEAKNIFSGIMKRAPADRRARGMAHPERYFELIWLWQDAQRRRESKQAFARRLQAERPRYYAASVQALVKKLDLWEKRPRGEDMFQKYAK
jgi:hypothetical protein